MKNWKIIFTVVVVIAIIGGVVGYMMWNKPHRKVEDIKGEEVTVTELAGAFAADEAKANEKYLNKALTVKGTVTETQQNQDGGLMIVLAGDDPMATVQCTMRDKDVKAGTGEAVTVKGFCTGSSLFGVLLSDCVMVK